MNASIQEKRLTESILLISALSPPVLTLTVYRNEFSSFSSVFWHIFEVVSFLFQFNLFGHLIRRRLVSVHTERESPSIHLIVLCVCLKSLHTDLNHFQCGTANCFFIISWTFHIRPCLLLLLIRGRCSA